MLGREACEAPGKVGGRGRRALRVAGWTAAGIALATVVVANVATVLYGETVDSFLGSDEVSVSETDLQAQLARDQILSERIEGEGLVLLRNQDETLPLSPNVTKVNVFGWGSTQWVSGGSGSGGVAGGCEGILDALTSQGISYNEELAELYRGFQGERPHLSAGTLGSTAEQFCCLYEPKISDESLYAPELLGRAKSYSNTAIVVLGRMAGESIDCPREQLRVNERGGSPIRSRGRNYLEPSPEEEELLAYVAANYENVIVLVNSTNAMELGLVEDIEGVDACVLVGATGGTGARSVVKALWGEINPSGRTADTYAYDLSTAASWANAGADGEGSYLGSKGLYPADGTANVNEGSPVGYDSLRFVDYAEGIYVGYRWYETADAEGFWDGVSNRHGIGYQGVVQYPFGFGLSYTTFSWDIVGRTPLRNSRLSADDRIEMTVRVTNTGSRAGRDVVELYVQAPYTPGGIEKPSCQLVAFAKTGLIEPGQSEDVTLGFGARDMASYDYLDANQNGFKGWELEEGEYLVQLRRDAHTLASCENASASYLVAHGQRYESDLQTGTEVRNRFTGEDAEGKVSIDGTSTGEGIRYLTRADFKSTFPLTGDVDRPIAPALRDMNLYREEDALAADAAAGQTLSQAGDGQGGEPAYLAHGATVSRKGKLTQLGLELGKNYDDPRWPLLLDRISQDDMERLVLHGYSNSAAIDAVGKERTKELDGSSQIGSFHQLRFGVAFPNPTVLAQAWSQELSHAFGQAAGMEAAMLGVDGWYAPACNIHRTPLGGRNYEYYSEDPLLSGVMAAGTVRGSREAGTFTYLKHLALNEQDSYRDSLYTWLTEQSLREIYLEPFRRAVQEGGATGMMSSYNRIGPVWAGGSHALITDVLRGEWGFRGSVITDYRDHHQYLNADQMLRAGGSLYMDGVFRDGRFAVGRGSENYRQQLRRATKDVMYVWLNARASNLSYNEAALENGWPPLERPIKTRGLSVLSASLAAIDAVTALLLVLVVRKRLRSRRGEAERG